MKKLVVVSVLSLAGMVCLQNISLAADTQTKTSAKVQKYAVVDVKTVVNSSKSVKELTETRKQQKETVMKFVKDGNAQVDAETDSVKKEALKKKLNNDLKYMTKTFDKRYQDGLKQVNNEISAEIAKVGKEKQYNLILTTDSVLYGGENITKDIVKAVK